MSDVSQGPGWWQASDGKWYPPEQAPGAAPAATPPPADPGFGAAPGAAPGFGGAPGAAPGYGTPGAVAPGAGYGVPGGAPAYGAPVGGPPADQLADWGLRVASGAIDFVALFVIAGILSEINYALGAIVWLIALGFAGYNGYLNGETGQSVGKRIVGTKVLGEATGQTIGGGAGILRWLCHIIDGFICGLGYLFPIWDAKKQTFGDKIMKTVVITGQEKKSFGDAFKG